MFLPQRSIVYLCNALQIAIEVYKKDAEACRTSGNTRLQAQFDLQVKETKQLHDWLYTCMFVDVR